MESKKEKAFSKGNFENWEIDPEKLADESLDKKNRQVAWSIMFPKESLEVTKCDQERCFFTEQLYKEVKRLHADNEDLMTADFNKMISLFRSNQPIYDQG